MKEFQELINMLEREIKKLEIVFKEIKVLDKDLEKFLNSYWNDCMYFYKKGDIIKSFELVNYIWGILDCMANKNLIEIPENIKKWFKI